MKLEDILSKTCVIGVSYFDQDEQLLKQAQYAGTVTEVDHELGISIRLQHADTAAGSAVFIVPPNLAAWFKAPPGQYHHAAAGVDMQNPDYLVTWNVYRTQSESADGQHVWWEWLPNTEAPQVGQPH
jgi:hypothetical protein